jgi:hypothetical protein
MPVGYIAALANPGAPHDLRGLIGRNLAAELLLAKNYVNKMITARESE